MGKLSKHAKNLTANDYSTMMAQSGVNYSKSRQ